MKGTGCLVTVGQSGMVAEGLALGANVEYLSSNLARNLDIVGEIVSDDWKLLEVVGIRESHPL